MNRLMISVIAAASLASVMPVAAQQKPEAAPRPAAEQIPLRVQLVVARYQNDKKISSIPYTLSVVANDNDKTSMRMGVDVPVPQTVYTKAGEVSPAQSYSYRSVGTNIDCSARTIEGGWFKLDLGVSDSAVYLPDKNGPGPSGLAGIPSFRSFTSTFNVLLKDGQTAQHIAATDPVSGEVLRVDVTLTVLK